MSIYWRVIGDLHHHALCSLAVQTHKPGHIQWHRRFGKRDTMLWNTKWAR